MKKKAFNISSLLSGVNKVYSFSLSVVTFCSGFYFLFLFFPQFVGEEFFLFTLVGLLAIFGISTFLINIKSISSEVFQAYKKFYKAVKLAGSILVMVLYLNLYLKFLPKLSVEFASQMEVVSDGLSRTAFYITSFIILVIFSFWLGALVAHLSVRFFNVGKLTKEKIINYWLIVFLVFWVVVIRIGGLRMIVKDSVLDPLYPNLKLLFSFSLFALHIRYFARWTRKFLEKKEVGFLDQLIKS